MSSLKYLNCVLSVIAFCLIMITLAVTGLIPAANAKSNPSPFVNMPVNKDGSLNVRLMNENIEVNIDEVGGHPVRNSIDMNIEAVGGVPLPNPAVPVRIKK